MPESLNTSLYMQFGKRGTNRVSAEVALVQDLICYDCIYVLTDQMDAVGRLALIMGWSAFATAVRENTIRFIHDRSILGWPKRVGRSGVTPFLSLSTVSQAGRPAGYSQAASGDLAARSLKGLGFPKQEVEEVCTRIDATAIDFGQVDESKPKPAGTLAETIGAKLKIYEDALTRLKWRDLTPADLIRLRQDLRDSNRTPLGQKTLNVMKVEFQSGDGLLVQEDLLSRKQLALLNLELADRFLEVHARSVPSATLHTEPTVGEVLAARLADVRHSAAGEVEVVLEAERVELPVLSQTRDFPYSDLMRARVSAAAEAFRSVVGRRDADVDATLIQEYMADLNRRVGDRFGVQAFRMLFTTVIGLLNPLAGLAAGAADSFAVSKILARNDARYYIDSTLRSLSKAR